MCPLGAKASDRLGIGTSPCYLVDQILLEVHIAWEQQSRFRVNIISSQLLRPKIVILH